jgi:hypothetical protein
MKSNRTKVFKKGTIVTVIEGRAFGCSPNTVTKILSKPGRVSDESAELLGKFYTESTYLIMVACQHSKSTCNNRPASYEYVDDLRLATEYEKKKFKSNNNQPIQI